MVLQRITTNNAKNLKHLAEVPYRSEIWERRYPTLYTILDGDPRLPTGNRFDHNTVIGGDGVLIADREGFDKYLSHIGNTYKEAPITGIRKNPCHETPKRVDLSKDFEP